MTSSYDAFQPESYQSVQYAAPSGPKEAVDMASIIARDYQQTEQANQTFYNQPSINNKINEANRKVDADKLEQQLAFKQSEFQKLTAFSDKLMEKTQNLLSYFQQQNQQRGAAIQARDGLTPEEQEAYQQEKQALEVEKQAALQEAGNIGSDINKVETEYKGKFGVLADRYRKTGEDRIAALGTSERIGYTQALMTQRKADYKADLTSRMSSDNKTILIDSLNNTFTPSSATTREQYNIASRAVTGQLVQEYGIGSANPALLEDMFYKGKDGARNTLTNYLAERNKANSINQGQKKVTLATMEVADAFKRGDTPNLANLINTLRSTPDNNNKYRSGSDVWKEAKGIFEGLISSNAATAEQIIQGLAASPDTQFDGKSMLEPRAKLAAQLRDYETTTRNNRTVAQNRSKDLDWGELEEDYQQLMKQKFRAKETFSREDYETMQQNLADLNGKRSTTLEKYYNNYSQEGVDFKFNSRIAEQMIAAGTWTEDKALEMGKKIYDEYGEKGRSLDIARAKTGNFKEIKTTIEATVRLGANQLGEDTDLPWTAKLVSNSLFEKVLARGAVLAQDTKYQNNEEGAYYAAMAEVMQYAKQEGLGNTNVQNGLYSDGLRGNFPKFTQQFLAGRPNSAGENVGGVTGTYEAVKKRNEKLDADLKKYNGLDAIDDPKLGKTEQPYVSTADLEANGENYDSRTWRPLATVQKMMEVDGNIFDPLALTNRLRASRGLPELPAPPSLELLNNKPTPEVQQAIRDLTLARSPNQATRAASQIGQFEPSLVPNGYGDYIVRASQGSGNRPALVNAIVGTETHHEDIGPGHPRWNGQDYGPGQVNQWHIDEGLYTYVPGDIDGNLKYAMGVYNDMKAEAVTRGVLPQYQEDFALAAYNGGPANIPVVDGIPQFPGWAQDYLTKVKRRLLDSGERQAYSSGYTMRGKFRTMQTSHPDTGTGYTIEGATDYKGRPVVLADPAMIALARMVQDSNGVVKYTDIVSAQRSQAKNNSLPGASPTSNHLTGNAIDIHGASKAWIKANGAKYGWINLVYDGHDGHFDFKP